MKVEIKERASILKDIEKELARTEKQKAKAVGEGRAYLLGKEVAYTEMKCLIENERTGYEKGRENS